MGSWILTVLLAGPAHAGCEVGGHVVLNEVVSDPSGADADAEWVELYNTGVTSVDLEGWTIENALSPDDIETVFTLPRGTTLGPEAYLVVAGPLAALPDIEVVRLDMNGETFGNASSSSDQVRLVDCSGALRDTVTYGSSNGEGQVFTDEDGVSVGEDMLAPKATSGKSMSRIPDGRESGDDALDFVVASPATPGSSNSGEAVVDCDTAGSPGEILINEFLANPGELTNPDGSSDDGYEWVELFNTRNRDVDVSGWRIEQASVPDHWGERVRVTLPEGTVIPGGGHLLIAEWLVDIPEGVDVHVIPDEGSFAFGNSEDALRLSDCGGVPIDTVLYGDGNPDGFTDDEGNVLENAAPDAASDHSLARRSDGFDSGADADQIDFVATLDVTPGSPNSDLRCKGTAGTVVINEFLANPTGSDSEVRNEWIELYNAGTEPVDISTWTVERAGTFGGDADLNRDVVHAFFPQTILDPGEYYVLSGLLTDFGDQRAESIDFYSGTDGDLVLLFDCEGTRADGVLYGGENADLLPEDDGFLPERGAPKPSDDQCVSRLDNGVDTNNSFQDFVTTGLCTPGEANAFGGGGGSAPPPATGCTARQPGTSGPRVVEPRTAGGCDAGGRGASLALLGTILLMRRRRER
jgi:hypothetical protein